MMILSVIYPMYNEAGNVQEIIERTEKSFQQYKHSPEDLEIICIDDYSTDKTYAELQIAQKKYSNIKIITQNQHVGHAKAISIGFSNVSKTTYTFLSDADLQYNPEEIIEFLKDMEENPSIQIINGWRHQKKYESSLKKFASMIYNWLCRLLFQTKLHDHASNFTLYRTKHIQNLVLRENDQRYIIPMIKKKFKIPNSKIEEKEISHHQRSYGKSKYPVWRKIVFGFFEIMKKKRILGRNYEKIS